MSKRKANTYFNINNKKTKKESYQCIVCMESKKKKDIINIHKDHFNMCKDCLSQQGQVLLRNNDLLPWKCSTCHEILSIDILKKFMDNYDNC